MGGLHGGGPWYAQLQETSMATPQDYTTGSAALTAYMKAFIENPANGVPVFAEGEAESFIGKMAAGGAKSVIDAVDAGRTAQETTA